jgi:hypothetical protein
MSTLGAKCGPDVSMTGEAVQHPRADDPGMGWFRTFIRSSFSRCIPNGLKLDSYLATVQAGLAGNTGGSDGPAVIPSESGPKETRAQLEARVDALRLNTNKCEPYTRNHIDFDADVYLSKTSGDRSLDDAYALVIYASRIHVSDVDRKPMNWDRMWSMGLPRFIWSYLPEELRRRKNASAEDVTKLFDTMFSYNGDADNEATLTDQRRVHRERQHWASVIMRTFTVDMTGALKSNVLLQGVDSPIPSELVHRSDRSTRFLERAKAYKLPTADEVERGINSQSTSSHPKLAAYRHQNAVSLRNLVRGLGCKQFDPSISSAPRDKNAYGQREVIQLKDLRHIGQSKAPDIDKLSEELNGCTPKTVVTLFDFVTYVKSLRAYAGSDMILTLPIYSSLSGNFEESTYYCEGVDDAGHARFCETIGANETSSYFNNQLSWDFGKNDVVYIRDLQNSGFGVYDVVKHCRHDINRQTVFLSMNSWVNMPFEIADKLVFSAHGVRLSDMYSEPQPCKNVKLVNGESNHPILVMSVVQGHESIVYTRYQNETSAAGTAKVSPTVLRFIQHLYSHGGRAHGLTSREILQRLQMYMAPLLPDGKANAPDYTSLLELYRVVGIPAQVPCAVFYSVPVFQAENPGEEAPTENRDAKAVAQIPSITSCPKTYGVVAPDDVATEKAAEEHLGEGNTIVRGAHLNKIVAFAQRQFITNLERDSECAAGSVRVVSREKVLENRTRATQRANETTSGLGPCGDDGIGRAFVKTNEVAALKPVARMIQSPPHELSIDSGRLGMSLDQIFKTTDESEGAGFYLPGKTPHEISLALRSQYAACKTMRTKYGAGMIPQVDYKNADKSHTEESAELVADIIRHFFSDEHCPDLGESHKTWALRTYYSCFNIKVQAGKKVKNTKWKNASGTGITTHLNTLVFAFRSYLTVLLAMFFQQSIGDDGVIKGFPIDEKGDPDPVAAGKADWFTNVMFRAQLKVLQAKDTKWWSETKNYSAAAPKAQIMRLLFDLIGLKFGDDGVEYNAPGVSDASWLLACKYLDAADGFTRTIEFSDPEIDAEIEFLSRMYPNLTETGASYCKLERACEKLRISTNTDLDKYRDKLVGYMITDRRTPIVGAFIKAIWAEKGFGKLPVQFNDYDRAIITDEYLDKVESRDRELARKMREGPYPVHDDDLDFMYVAAAAQYGWTSAELRAFDASLSEQTTIDGIRSHKLPPALANLTAGDPVGDDMTPTVPDGMAMVEAFPNQEALMNAMPEPVKRKSRALLEEILEKL